MWFGWFYLLSPCAALLPLLPGGPARHCVPRPSAAWHSLPDTMQQPSLHARASELRAAAGQGPRGPGLQRPSPPAEGIPWPFGHAHPVDNLRVAKYSSSRARLVLGLQGTDFGQRWLVGTGMVTRDRFSYSNYRFTREERRYTPLKAAAGAVSARCSSGNCSYG